MEPSGSARGRTLRESVIVEVRRPSGAVGYGEAAPLAPGDSIGEVLRALNVASVYSPSAAFAVETAELDALARERGEPLLAGAASLPIAVVVDEPVAALARHIKIKVGPDGDLDRVRAIAAANPHAQLRLDANRSWPRDTVHERMAALADLNIEFIEEPCIDAHTIAGLPLALDESLLDDPDLTNVKFVVLKPTVLGGIGACRRIAERAKERGIGVVVTHALEGPIGTAACAQLALAIGDRAAGLGAHPALVAWDMHVPQITATEIRVARPGLGLDVAAIEDAMIALRDPLSSAPGAARGRCIVATPAQDTIDAIHAALHERRPIALIHHKLPAEEQARQRALAEAAILDEGDVVLFTSGSTGAARGVVLSREAMIAATEASAEHLGWRDDDRWLLALSMAHAGGLAVVVRCLAARRDVILAGESLADSLAQCTLASLVPTQLAQLLDDPAWQPPPQLRAILLGGAAAPPALLAAAAARGVPFLATYGMTETFGQIATALPDRAGDPEAPLVLLPHATVEATPRLRIHSTALARRYLDGEPIAPAFTTADLGVVAGAKLRIFGRADDVIITGGENVHPATVEAVLAATPGVRAACAFGVPDERWGQRVGAALAVDPSFDLGTAVARWQAALPPFARPREIATVDLLPTSPNGKLDRRAASQIPRSRV